MKITRLVVTGAVGAGKSAFIRSISETEVLDTERRCTDEVALLKQTTTVAFDLGQMNFGSDRTLYFYGTPGQSRFDFMWNILIRKAHAYILLVAAHRPEDFHCVREIISFMNQQVQIPLVIGLTHRDYPDAWSEEDVAIALGYVDQQTRPLIVSVNPTQTTSVAQAMTTIMQHPTLSSVLE